MAEVKCIPIPADIADGMGSRFTALEGMLKCIGTSLDEVEGDAASAAADAVRGAAEYVERLMLDLDVFAWDRQPVTEVKTS
jgi:hypothetical protein